MTLINEGFVFGICLVVAFLLSVDHKKKGDRESERKISKEDVLLDEFFQLERMIYQSRDIVSLHIIRKKIDEFRELDREGIGRKLSGRLYATLENRRAYLGYMPSAN